MAISSSVDTCAVAITAWQSTTVHATGTGNAGPWIAAAGEGTYSCETDCLDSCRLSAVPLCQQDCQQQHPTALLTTTTKAPTTGKPIIDCCPAAAPLQAATLFKRHATSEVNHGHYMIATNSARAARRVAANSESLSSRGMGREETLLGVQKLERAAYGVCTDGH